MADKPTPATTLEQASRRRGTGKKLAGRVIVQILPSLNQGGVERGTLEMAEAVIREGGRAVVISGGGPMVSRLLQLGAEHVKLPVGSKNPLLWPIIGSRVRRALKRCGADLVHIRSRAPGWIAIPAARRLGLPVVTTIHARMRKANPVKGLYNSVMVRGDRVIAISKYIQRLVLELYPETEDRLVVIPRGVDISIFAPDQVSPTRIIQASNLLGLPDDHPIIMLPARPSEWKGADQLIEAAGLIRDEDFFVMLVGAGDGGKDYQRGLAALIRANGLEGRVRLCEGVDDMPAVLMLADVVVMPSKSPEPFGRVAIEASAMGCPVVAFDHGGASESIKHGATGWLARPLDVQSLADCLREALDIGSHQRLLLSKNAREFVTAKFTSERMCKKTVTVYAELLRDKAKR